MTDIQPPAAATDTDQTAETDTQETEHPLITDHRETHTIIDRSQSLLVDQGHPDIIPIQDKVGHPTERTGRTGTVPCPQGTPTLS